MARPGTVTRLPRLVRWDGETDHTIVRNLCNDADDQDNAVDALTIEVAALRKVLGRILIGLVAVLTTGLVDLLIQVRR